MTAKRILPLLVLLLVAVHAAAADSAVLAVKVVGVVAGQGQVNVSLFESPATYLKQPLLERRQRAGDGDTVVVSIEGLTPGDYAVSVFYDLDGDGEMATRMFGIPKEPVGFSNDARGKFGPAKWKDSHFTLDGDLQITVNLETP